MPISIDTTAVDQAYDEESNKFITLPSYHLEMEYSLKAIAEWESIFHKPFFSRNEKTTEESLTFLQCMTLNERPSLYVYNLISQDEGNRLKEYMKSTMTASTVDNSGGEGSSSEFISAETIYNNMIDLKIPFECENWHYNRLQALMSFRAAKLNNQMGNNKMTQQDIVAQNRDINKRNKERLKRLKEQENK